MRNFRVLTCGLSMLVAACSSGGSSSGTVTGPTGSAPTPTPAPAPTPTPTPTPASTATVTFLHSYQPVLAGGGEKALGLIRAGDGNSYSFRTQHGPNTCRPALPIPCGAIMKVTPTGEESVFYAFGGVANDGYAPVALILGRDGALYGLTNNGGTYGGGGTFFKLTLSGTYTSLYSFGGSASDGVVPLNLIQASDGNFYGTTASGGANHCAQIPQDGSNCGTVFKLTPGGVETVLHSFGASASDGIEPLGAFIEGDDGNFYGTTSIGGSNQCASSPHDCGTVFKITPAGTLTILHSFGASPGDGIAPQGALIRGNDGALYGTTVSGGGGNCGWAFGCGTVFRVTTSGQLTILYAFAPASVADGHGPSSLILGRDGNFYGTTYSGGARQCDSCGTVFRLTPSGVKTILYSFGPVNEAPTRPTALTEGSDGALYGLNEWDVSLSGNPWVVFRVSGG